MPGTGWVSRLVLASVWLLVGAAMVGVPLWLAWTRWEVLLTSHPVTVAVVVATGMVGVVAVLWASATLLIGRDTQRDMTWRLVVSPPLLVLCVLLVAVLAWSRPFQATDAAAKAARSSPTVRVIDKLTWLEMVPTRRNARGDLIKPTTGLVFIPGARVDSRAYASLLAPLAQQGFLVALLKEPLGLSLTHRDHAAAVLKVHPEIRFWSVGGHSLGGVTAAAFADRTPQVAALTLYASYPAGRLERTDLKVLSVSGDADSRTTKEEIEQAKSLLPPQTRHVVIPGATHSFFGDYGDRPEDGTPTAERKSAQAQIRAETARLLLSLAPPRR